MHNDDEIQRAVKDALVERSLTDIAKELRTISSDLAMGFAKIHARQDTTNGKVLTAEKDILILKTKSRFDKVVWFLFTAAITALTGLITYLSTSHS